MTRVRTLLKSAILSFLERRPRDWKFRVGAALAGSKTHAQSFLLRSLLGHSRPEWKSLRFVETYANRLPNRDLIFALAKSSASPNVELASHLSHLATRPIPALEYVRAFFERRFVDAFDIWQQFPEVATRLESLARPPVDGLTRSMAVVLPGPADEPFGEEIDAHDLVARTGIVAPTGEDSMLVGSRFDISFFNPPRFRKLLLSPEPSVCTAGRFVVDVKFQTMKLPAWMSTPITCDMSEFLPPASHYAYAPLRIVQWSHERGILPTLYFGDFYLGDVAYQSGHYDPAEMLKSSQRILLSYLLHDVFFAHRLLQIWKRHEVIRTRGRLDDILDVDGRSFAELIQHRWGEGNN